MIWWIVGPILLIAGVGCIVAGYKINLRPDIDKEGRIHWQKPSVSYPDLDVRASVAILLIAGILLAAAGLFVLFCFCLCGGYHPVSNGI